MVGESMTLSNLVEGSGLGDVLSSIAFACEPGH